MYRTVAFCCKKMGLDTTKEEDVVSALPKISMDIKQENGVQKIYVDGEDVTEKIRTAEMGKGASEVAVILPVREKLVMLQRQLAEGTSVIMDGRDIGTNVLPNAQVKIYLNASVDERANRRCGELEKFGNESYDFESG